jgi:hypothetical protein
MCSEGHEARAHEQYLAKYGEIGDIEPISLPEASRHVVAMTQAQRQVL